MSPRRDALHRMTRTASLIVLIAGMPSAVARVPLQEKRPDVNLGSTTPWAPQSKARGATTQSTSKNDDLGSADGTCHDPGRGLCSSPDLTYQQAWQKVDQRVAANFDTTRRLPRKRFVPCAQKLGYTETSCVDNTGFESLLYCMGVA